MRILEYCADRADEGIRLELVLKRRLQLTDRQIRQLKYLPMGITVNSMQQRTTYCVCRGDRIRIAFSDRKRRVGHLLPAGKGAQDSVEDEDLLVIDKMAGEICHPAHGHYQDTPSPIRWPPIWRKKDEDPALIRCIGRLDKDTSGTLLFAKNQLAAGRLAVQREEGILYKEYLALANGVFAPEAYRGEIRLPIGPVPGSLMKMQTTPEGKTCRDKLSGICSDGRCSLVLCRIRTGRTQPDPRSYGGSGASAAGRSDLWKRYGNFFFPDSAHAWRLSLRQPVDRRRVVHRKFPARYVFHEKGNSAIENHFAVGGCPQALRFQPGLCIYCTDLAER